jgi:hypothetical protein
MCRPLFESCMEACLACARACDELAKKFNDLPDETEFVQACRDCAFSCTLCYSDLRDGSPLMAHSTIRCDRACYIVTLGCERHKADDVDRCLVACRLCADECREVRRQLGELEVQKLHAADLPVT